MLLLCEKIQQLMIYTSGNLHVMLIDIKTMTVKGFMDAREWNGEEWSTGSVSRAPPMSKSEATAFQDQASFSSSILLNLRVGIR